MPDLRGARRHRRDPPERLEPTRTSAAPTRADVTYGTNSEFGFDYLRDNMAHDARGEGPARRAHRRGRPRRSRMHYFAIVDEVDNILIDEARTPLIISGAPEARRRLLRAVRASSRRSWSPGKTPEGMDPRAARTSSPTSTTSSTRSTRPSRSPSSGVEKAERFLGIDHLYRAENGPLVNHLHPGAEGRVALQARRRLRGHRRRGQDHRRVHRPHPRGPPLVGGPAPGGRGQGGRARSRRRTRRSPRSPTRTTSASTTSSPA